MALTKTKLFGECRNIGECVCGLCDDVANNRDVPKLAEPYDGPLKPCEDCGGAHFKATCPQKQPGTYARIPPGTSTSLKPKQSIPAPMEQKVDCGYCHRRGAPCARHGGERSGVHTAKKFAEREKSDGRIATNLPEPAPVTVPEQRAIPIPDDFGTRELKLVVSDLDPELAAIQAILISLEPLESAQVDRIMRYVSERTGWLEVIKSPQGTEQ